MNWFDKLEKKFGRFAIKNLMYYIVGLNALVFMLTLVDTTGVFVNKLELIPSLVLKGEVWRIVSYVFIPPSSSAIFMVFVLYLYFLIGTSLESEWGSFRFNLYYILGMLGTTISAFITSSPTTSTYINLSLFLAFARIYPDYELLMFFILPIKIKYLALLDWLFIIYSIVFYPLPLKLAAVASVVNFLVFFGKDILLNSKNRTSSYYRKQKFISSMPDKNHTIHKCTVCGMTELDDPNMEFRYCSKCSGRHEYCMKHLKDHEHI